MLRSLLEDHRTLAIGEYIRRAREERELAARANSAGSAQAHLKLAHHYEVLVANAETLRQDALASCDDYAGMGSSLHSNACFPFCSPRSAMRTSRARPHY